MHLFDELIHYARCLEASFRSTYRSQKSSPTAQKVYFLIIFFFRYGYHITVCILLLFFLLMVVLLLMGSD